MGRSPSFLRVVEAAPVARQRLALWKHLLRFAVVCLARRRERHDLKRLDDHLLKDVGLTRYDVHKEIRKWPWEL